jgi:hypothetical protein
MTESREFELDSIQSTRLLDLGLSSPTGNDDAVNPDDQRKDLLYQILASPLPVSDQTRESLPPILQGQSQDLLALSGRPVGDLLQDAHTDIGVIRRIKEFAKEQGATAPSKEAEDAFMAVYLAAIASALTFHGQRISQHNSNDLRNFFGAFAKKTWVLSELKPLFSRAGEQLDPQ